jgi:hypothetical protein
LQDTAKRTNQQQPPVRREVKNDKLSRELLTSITPQASLFQKSEFHGNVKWCPEKVVWKQHIRCCQNQQVRGHQGGGAEALA